MSNNAIPILDLTISTMDLLNEKGQMAFSEIVQKLQKPKTSVYRVLKTLEEKKWLFYEKESKTYQISTAFLRYAKPKTDNELVKTFNLLVQKWQKKIPHTMQLAALEGVNSFFISVVHPNNTIIPNTYIGKYGPVHATAAGKIFLANREGLLNQIKEKKLEAKTVNTITNLNQLQQELKKVKEKDYAVTAEEFSLNLCCLAVPVRDYKGEVCAVIDLCIPTDRITDNQISTYVPLMHEMRKEMEATL